MELQNKIDKNKEIIYQLAVDIQNDVGRLMKEQLENIHGPKIIAIDSEAFLSDLSQ
jgi:hypothetical protein